MKSIEELTSRGNKPRLVPTFKQQERNLLSVFMSLIDIVPAIRGEFLKTCGYASGRTCQYQSHMEVTYTSPRFPEVRPDGLLNCIRGKNEWAAFVEAKASNSPIRPEQIIEYLDLAAMVDVGTIITISNEFARVPAELPYHIAASKRRKADVFHFAWADIRTFLALQMNNPDIDEVEHKILAECLEFFWEPTCGIITYDAMPPDWPKFVEASGNALGFGTNTKGITEIVHGWAQERRDLCSKLIHETYDIVELGHQAGVRADADLRLKVDRKALADDYSLSAEYIFKKSKTKLKILAKLGRCKTSLALEMPPPANRMAKASVNWFVNSASDLDLSDAIISFDWKGTRQDVTIPFPELKSNPELGYGDQKEAPRSIRVIRDIHDVRRFKSRKKFIEDIEKLALSTVRDAKIAGWL